MAVGTEQIQKVWPGNLEKGEVTINLGCESFIGFLHVAGSVRPSRFVAPDAPELEADEG